MRADQHGAAVVGDLVDDQFGQVGKDNSRQQAFPAAGCCAQGTMNLAAALLTIKFLVEPRSSRSGRTNERAVT
jgi:hypothetical protein